MQSDSESSTGKKENECILMNTRHLQLFKGPFQATAFVAEKSELIQKAFKRLEEQGYSFNTDLLLPDTIQVEPVNERYTVIYRKTRSREAVLTGNQNELLVPENKVNSKWCLSILKAWLQKQGRVHLVLWLRRLSDDTGLEYKKVQVRDQKDHWGSCSTTGTILLNCKLLFCRRSRSIIL